MTKTTLRAPLLRAVPALLMSLSCGVFAAGLQLPEQNASGLGVAYAGSAAVAENASTVYFNPAGLSLLPGRQVSLGLAGEKSGYRFSNRGSSGLGVGGGNGGDAGSVLGVPNAYLSWQVAPRWTAGLGISTPFGLKTDYDGGWVGRYQALKTELKTLNVNPAVAYQVTDSLSLGAGLNYQRAELQMSYLTAAGALSSFKGDDTAWGWNAGALWTLSPAMRVGIAYRSALKYRLDGTQQPAQPATLRLDLPDNLTLSVWQQVSDRWEAMGDLSWTGWNSINRLDVVSRNGGGQLASESLGLRNSWRFAWGAAYKASDAWKYKFGVAYERSPVLAGERTAALPDNDRIWLSLGAQWRPLPQAVIDLGYAYIYMRDARINQGNVGNTAVLRGQYDAGVHVLGLQYTQGF